jgi:hypothetical protein
MQSAAAVNKSAHEPSPQSENVTLVFESDPPGAEARIVGIATPLGVTPFERQFPRNAAPLEVELSLPGYESARVTTTAAAGRTLNVKLTRASTMLPRRVRPTIGKETTIDPFR